MISTDTAATSANGMAGAGATKDHMAKARTATSITPGTNQAET